MAATLAAMQLAPQIPFTVRSRHVASGMAGVRQTIGVMRAMVNDFKDDPAVRRAAANAIWMVPEKSELHEAHALFELVRDGVRYVRDVYGVETIQEPMTTLAARIGDCDDQSTLLATLLESVGYQTRFVVAGYTLPDHAEHVYVEALLNGEWVPMDPTEHKFLGWAPPGPTLLLHEVV
jgi:transglutaminase-like putative cysteine protease